MANTEYSVSLAENDDQGDRCGQMNRIKFRIDNETVLDMERRDLVGFTKVVHNQGFLVVYGAKFKYTHSIDWHGNRMWNSYKMEEGYFKSLLKLFYHHIEWRVFEECPDDIAALGIENSPTEIGKDESIVSTDDKQLELFN
jgi:hypothetical protein